MKKEKRYIMCLDYDTWYKLQRVSYALTVRRSEYVSVAQIIREAVEYYFANKLGDLVVKIQTGETDKV